MAKFENKSGREIVYRGKTIKPGGTFEAEKLPGSLRLMAEGFAENIDPKNPPAGAQFRPGDPQSPDEARSERAETVEKSVAAAKAATAAKPAPKE